MLKDLAINRDLSVRVRAYLLQCEERERRANYPTMLGELSEQLQARCCLYFHSTLVCSSVCSFVSL